MFATLSDRLAATFKSIGGKGKLSAADVDLVCREIRVALLEADVALPVVRGFVAAVRERASGAELSGALNPRQQILKIVNDELVRILGGQTRRLRLAKNPPTVIMLAGLQGSGKTTLAGKLGLWLKKQGHTPLLVAADLQRPNAVQQLQIVGERAGVSVFAPERGNDGVAPERGNDGTSTSLGEYDPDPSGTRSYGDPVAVAREGLAHAKAKLHDVLIVDTAGRLGVDANLMAQAASIRDAVHPDEILFVLDAMIGQDAVATAQAFLDGVDFDAVVLTKLDGDARGGAALSVAEVTGRPIMFASAGEKLTDFDLFHPDRMAGRILDMGDLATLFEQAEQAFDAESSKTMMNRLTGADGGLTLDDFLEQMQSVRKMGPLGGILRMLPGMGQMREQLDNLDEGELTRVEAIIRSMTPFERAHPEKIDGSRRLRISRGSGTGVSDVSGLVERFTQARSMMKKFSGKKGMKQLSQMMNGGGQPGMGGGAPALPGGMGGMPGLPGMGGMPGFGGAVSKSRPSKSSRPSGAKGKQARSGNPAKRANTLAAGSEVADAEITGAQRPAGGAFGG